MKASLLIIGLFVLVTRAEARQKWSKGFVVLNSEQVRVGQLKYRWKWDAVLFKDDSSVTVETYPASQLLSFRFFDRDLEVVRKFRTYTKHAHGFDRPVFYEVVMSGNYTLLRKEKLYVYYNTQATGVSRKKRMLREQAKDFDYFFLHDGAVVPLMNFKQAMKGKDTFEELNEFAGRRKLSWHARHDIMLLINHLNCQTDDGCIPGLGHDRTAYSQ